MKCSAVAVSIAAATIAGGCAAGGGGDAPTLREQLGVKPQSCGIPARARPSLARVAGASSARAQADAVVAVVERLRGLRFKRDVRPTFVSYERLTEELVSEDAEVLTEREADDFERVLILLGAVPTNFDLRAAFAEEASDVAGFYDSRTEELFVAQQDRRGTLDAYELEVLAHELAHALVDQNFGLPDETEAPGWRDAEAATTAAIEGDAMLLELRMTALLEGREALDAVLDTPVSAIFAGGDLPHYLDAAFAFPYVEGLRFACTLEARRGRRALDVALEAPPTTTAEILFPERYVRGERARTPEPPRGLPKPWRRAPSASGVFGAADLLWLFEAPGGNNERALRSPRESVRGWGGGRIVLWTRQADSALSIRIVARASALCPSVIEWYSRSFDDDVERRGGRRATFDSPLYDTAIVCTAREVRVAIAPDAATARLLVG